MYPDLWGRMEHCAHFLYFDVNMIDTSFQVSGAMNHDRNIVDHRQQVIGGLCHFLKILPLLIGKDIPRSTKNQQQQHSF